MSREVRRVPVDWTHPTTTAGMIQDGGRNHVPKWHPLTAEEMDLIIGDRPRPLYQMYETTSEGTPISPPMPEPDLLARWLADNHASAFGSMTGTYDQWLAMITGSGVTVGVAVKGGERSPGWLDDKASPR